MQHCQHCISHDHGFKLLLNSTVCMCMGKYVMASVAATLNIQLCKHDAGINAYAETHVFERKLVYIHMRAYHYAIDCTAGRHVQDIEICRYLSMGIVSWQALSSTASTSCPRAYMFLSALITTGGLSTRLLPCANKKCYLSALYNFKCTHAW